ncbi:hypothetical protein ACOX9X_17385 [Photobacterium leiognathi subsp. mandapamensis]|uniref:hypothetical protein n=1 Tax=Photobacterium leiognathi TaxID=553611 RepID=UPI003BF4987B
MKYVYFFISAILMLGTGCSINKNIYPENAAPPTLLEMANHQTSAKVCTLIGMAREQGNDELVSQLGFIFSSRRDIPLRDCIRFADLGQKEERVAKINKTNLLNH